MNCQTCGDEGFWEQPCADCGKKGPSPGTNGAVCEMCCGNGTWYRKDTGGGPCPDCNGTGRAKADCAPVAAGLPAGSLAAQIESAAGSWATVPDRYKGEPSKRDATEVRRCAICDDYGFLSQKLPASPCPACASKPDKYQLGLGGYMVKATEASRATKYVLAADHTAAIQASLAREAALEAKVALYATEIEADIEAFKERDCVLENAANTMTELRIERDALRSRLAAVEAERDKLKAAGKILVASNTRILDEAREQLTLQAEKVGRMREALSTARRALYRAGRRNY